MLLNTLVIVAIFKVSHNSVSDGSGFKQESGPMGSILAPADEAGGPSSGLRACSREH